MVLENTVEHNDDRSKLDRDVTDNELKNNGHTAVSRHVRSDGIKMVRSARSSLSL